MRNTKKQYKMNKKEKVMTMNRKWLVKFLKINDTVG